MRKDITPRDMLMDRRVVERNIRKGLVTPEEYAQYLATLPDVGENAEEVRAKLGEDESLDDMDDLPEDEDEDEG